MSYRESVDGAAITAEDEARVSASQLSLTKKQLDVYPWGERVENSTALTSAVRGPIRAGAADRPADPQLRHDALHAAATIALLVEAVRNDPGLGPDSLHLLTLVDSEACRLSELVAVGGTTSPEAPVEAVEVDRIVAEVVATAGGCGTAQVTCQSEPALAAVSATGLWRALHNVVDNAVRAVGHRGIVAVRVSRQPGFVIVEVDDNGPGFPYGPRGLSSLGLGVVQDFVSGYAGTLEIGTGALGGCCVRLLLPVGGADALIDVSAVIDVHDPLDVTDLIPGPRLGAVPTDG